MHSLGLIGGWSYVEGGMGRISLCLADAARDAGAVVATGVPVAAIEPVEGVRLEDGEIVRAGAVVSSADPVRTLALCDGDVPDAFHARVDAWRCESPVVKVNCALSRLPTFSAEPDRPDHVYRAQVEIARGIDDTQSAYDACRRGDPAPEWCEIYFQTAYDPSVAPPGSDTMSVFAQYARTRWSTGRGRRAARRSATGSSMPSPGSRRTSPTACSNARSSDRPTSSPASA
jgi:phytoene dehydrogenase-like protein